MSAKPTLIHLLVDESLKAMLDDFRFQHRFPSRAAAMKWLLQWALKENPKP